MGPSQTFNFFFSETGEVGVLMGMILGGREKAVFPENGKLLQPFDVWVRGAAPVEGGWLRLDELSMPPSNRPLCY